MFSNVFILMGPRWRTCAALLVLLCLEAGVARAVEQQPALDDGTSGRRVPLMAQAHLAVSEMVTETFNRIDDFFGNQQIEEESTGSRLRLNVLGVFEERGRFSLKANFREKIQLPRLSERLHLVIGGDSEEDPAEDRVVDEDPEALQTESPLPTEDGVADSVSLRYYHRDSPKWNLHTSAGVRGISLLDPFVRVRARRAVPLGNWLAKLVVAPFWSNRQGLGTTTELQFDRAVSQRLSFRASTQGHWLADTDSFNSSQRIFLYHLLSDRNSLEWQAGLFAENKPRQQVSSAQLGVTFRRRIYQHWLYFELQPAVQFPREQDFEAAASLSAKLEIIFGRPRNPIEKQPRG